MTSIPFSRAATNSSWLSGNALPAITICPSLILEALKGSIGIPASSSPLCVKKYSSKSEPCTLYPSPCRTNARALIPEPLIPVK